MERSSVIQAYTDLIRRKMLLFVIFSCAVVGLGCYALARGSFDISPLRVIATVFGQGEGSTGVVIWNIRMPRIIAAIVAGWCLGLSGAVMQCLLKNPLASPFTLGISQGAAFGAAFAIVVLGAGGAEVAVGHSSTVQTTSAAGPMTIKNIYSVTFCAFIGALIGTLVILALARLKKMAAESIILAGVALSSLFVSGTILVQYFATEVEIASVVFWTFGDVSRSNWREIGFMTASAVVVTFYFGLRFWDLNALSAGEDVARSLGVNVDRFRLIGMFLTALIASLVTAFLGVIAFLGLLAPHIGRRLVGGDHRYLIPHSCIIGSLLLLLADTISRILVGSGTLPVGVLTSFMGAPLFLYLLMRGYSR
ncbi:FecCD family ABC transporter permease [Desulfomonile tiedjei]|nr:iron ABC transporter permease [Desulfomonile tiedjei]